MRPRNRENSQAGRWFSAVLAGLVIAVMEITFALAYTSLLFSNDLSEFLDKGFVILLTASVLSIVIIALLSSYRGSISSSQDIPAALIAIMASSVLAGMAAQNIDGQIAFSTIIALLVVTATGTGLLLLLMAIFRLEQLMRFIPYSVIGGLLASTGWILVVVALGMLIGKPLNLETAALLLETETIFRWLPSLLIAALMLLCSRRLKSPLIIPAIVVASFIGIHLILKLLGISIDRAQSLGLMLEINSGNITFGLNTLQLVSQADWSLVGSQIGTIISICLVSALIVLVQISSLEVSINKDMDMRRDLFAAGLANIGVGMSGGVIAYHHISDTLLANRLGASQRTTGLFCAGFAALALFLDSQWLSYLPIPVLAGLLLYLGLDFLLDWLLRPAARLPIQEYLVLLLIFILVVLVNFPVGVLAGVMCGFILFAINYSRIDTIDHIIDGKECRSMVIRPQEKEAILNAAIGAISLVKLKGYLFFGSANLLLEQIKNHATESASTHSTPLRYLILDLGKVPDLDFTSMQGLLKVKKALQTNHIKVWLSNVPARSQQHLDQVMDNANSDTQPIIFSSADAAIEAAEEQLLIDHATQASDLDEHTNDNLADTPGSTEASKADNDNNGNGVATLFEQIHLDQEEASAVSAMLQFTKVEDKQVIVESGQYEQSFFIINSGTVGVYQLNNGKLQRLRVLTPGMVVGEMSMYNEMPRSADLIAIGKVELAEFSNARLLELENVLPSAAIKIHRALGKRLANMLLEERQLIAVRS